MVLEGKINGDGMLAQIIVDVPLMQTDQAYSYRVPAELEEGSRLACVSMYPLVREIG